jgi:sarcosine oxidase
MSNEFDTIVCGLGAMGSAAVYQLAKRGNKVLGLDRFSPPHDNGSSHGESRIIRQAIGEGEEYVPLVLRSYELWREIEEATGRELLTITGGLTLESQNSEAVMHGRRNFLDQAIRCAENFDIRYEVLETADIRRRYPQFAVTDERAYFEYETGFLRPELCIEAQLQLARKYGAAVQTDQTVVSVGSRGDSGVMVKTSRSTYCAEKVIITAGPWIARFLPQAYAHLFKVHRQVMYWFDIEEDCCSTFAPPGFPISSGSLRRPASLVSMVFRRSTAKRSRSRPSNLRRSPIQITCGAWSPWKKSNPCTENMYKAACRGFPIDAEAQRAACTRRHPIPISSSTFTPITTAL